ncbi:unnamed protein product [Adineta steineri]|uniref:ADP ribosyltransferase domain-containing protein n=2 Tax=Adineta steineri TaxID=433720 RepID=A0A814IR00_9BILA|nr:unnamed protein product [Adineta steineri]CAF3939077.1 unnamed protein product [Adineta steineri]
MPNHSQEFTSKYIIIWLDRDLDISNEDNQELLSRLHSAVSIIKTFTNMDQCITYLEQIQNEKVFLIISDYFIKQIASLEEQFNQINSVYIFSNRKSKSSDTTIPYTKGKGIFTHMKQLCNELIQEIRQLNKDLTSISIIPVQSIDQNFNGIDPLFMYLQLLKENLFTLNDDRKTEIKQFIDYCRLHCANSTEETENINDFETGYDKEKTPIEWYTMEGFLYRMLNEALREVNIEVLMKMAFFIRDLHKQIKQRHLEPSIAKIPSTIYRGQGMFNRDFEKLKKSQGGFLSFNNFLSTTCKEHVARGFAERSRDKLEKTPILFEISIDPSIVTVPFSLIMDLSKFPDEEEILFSTSTVFRIDKIQKVENRLWKVNLTYTNESDPLLKRLADHIRISMGGGNVWRKLGQLMIKMGQFDSALKTFETLLETNDSNDKTENAFLHNQVGYILKQQNKLKEAFFHYQESIKINRTHMSETDPRLSSTYSNIGGILKKLGDTNGALKFYELVLKIDLAAAQPNQLEIAIDHNNIGAVFDDQGKYSEALKKYEQALDIKLAYLPPHHPSLASTYSNIGSIHQKMGDISMALSFYEKTLEIQQKSLPPNHPSLVVTYGKLATVLVELHRYEEATNYAEQSAIVAKNAFGSSHPETTKRERYFDELRKKHHVS